MIEGKDPIWETDNYDVVLAGVSTYHRMTNGYLSKLRFKYPEAGEADRGTPYGDRNKLGTLVTAGENPVICLMYVSGFPYGNRDSMDYGSVGKCLSLAAARFRGKRIMSTIPGCTGLDGNADRDRVMSLMKEAFRDTDVDVYDCRFVDRNEEMEAVRRRARAAGFDGSQVKEILRKLYLIGNNGKTAAETEKKA